MFGRSVPVRYHGDRHVEPGGCHGADDARRQRCGNENGGIGDPVPEGVVEENAEQPVLEQVDRLLHVA